LAAALDRAACERSKLLADLTAIGPNLTLTEHLRALEAKEVELTSRMVSLQEEIDWDVLRSYGLVPDDFPTGGVEAPPLAVGQRAFELLSEPTATRDGAVGEAADGPAADDLHTDWPEDYRDVVDKRIEVLRSDPDVGQIERGENKRRWNRAPWQEREREALGRVVLDSLEAPDVWADFRLRSTAELTDHLRRRPILVEALELLAVRKDADIGTALAQLVLEASVPELAAQRLTDAGLAKRAVWERVWDLQRAEDRDEEVHAIPLPPKYSSADFRSVVFWKHRGKLDVPKERFVLIPNAQRGADASPVVGWAGWDERDLARALAGRITELREHDAADAARVTPLLAGMLELLPWIHQWHPESDPLYAGPPGAFFEGWLDGQLAELSITREALRAWRPLAPTRGRKAKATDA